MLITSQSRNDSKSRGFTIVELLIVVVVIAILATITIVTYNGIQQRAWNARAVASADAYKKLLMLYAVDNGSYPTYPASQVCLGSGYPDKNGDGKGDCVVESSGTVITSELLPADDPLISVTKSRPVVGDGPYLKRDRPAPDNQFFVISAVRYAYMGNTFYNGVASPHWLVYLIRGVGTDCRKPVALNTVAGSLVFTDVSESAMKNDTWKECYEALPVVTR